MKVKKRIADFTLLCMYLSSWKEDALEFPCLERNPVTHILRAWKGYFNSDLEILHIHRYIYLPIRAKTLLLTPEGMEKAIDIHRYGFKQGSTIQEKRLELSLLLIYLTGWEEEWRANPGQIILRGYRAFLLEVLQVLANEKMIDLNKNSSYVIITQKGIAHATSLEQELFLECNTAA